jgi:ribose 5-phosphate isomerase B
MPFTVAIASDHAGYLYKQALVALLEAEGQRVLDLGTHSEDPVDYPDYVRRVADALGAGECERGIVLGGSGNGEAIVVNRVRGVRCAVCWSEQTAVWARAHNDANCISIGQRTISIDEAKQIVRLFLATPFEGGRHVARIAKIER